MRKALSYKMLALSCIAGVGMVGSANAQLASATNNLVTARTTQNLAGVAVGTGTKQGASVVDVQSQGRPAVGVGVGSGKVDHFGSTASVSVANNARIVGVDGPGGVNSPNSISVRNPTQRPILSGVGNAPGALPH
ncbi:hypothetical protein [Sphingomonas sp.]|uniref:hypothetical protein n=1 Tax=Sphingomonas sp. TaxID=28214 RepID=UPI003B3AB401